MSKTLLQCRDLHLTVTALQIVIRLYQIAKIVKLNETLALLNNSPISKNKLTKKKYPIAKRKQIIYKMDKKVFHIKNIKNKETCVVSKLKEVFKKTENKQLRLKILTIFADWSYRQIRNHFDASNHMITVAKNSTKRYSFFSESQSRQES